jgi:hypothetical protein
MRAMWLKCKRRAVHVTWKSLTSNTFDFASAPKATYLSSKRRTESRSKYRIALLDIA